MRHKMSNGYTLILIDGYILSEVDDSKRKAINTLQNNRIADNISDAENHIKLIVLKIRLDAI